MGILTKGTDHSKRMKDISHYDNRSDYAKTLFLNSPRLFCRVTAEGGTPSITLEGVLQRKVAT